MTLMTKTSQISLMIQYLKNRNMQNKRLNEHERSDLLAHIAQRKNRARPQLKKGPKEIRVQLGINNTMPKDLLEISALLTEKQNSLLTLKQIFP